MLRNVDIAERLAEGLAAVRARDAASTAVLESWLLSMPARDLLRVDQAARHWRLAALGSAEEWSDRALRGSGHVGVALASMHYNGHVREAALRLLAQMGEALADRMVAVRLDDNVPLIREAATRSLLNRTSLAQASRIVPVLQFLESRARAAEALLVYLHAVSADHGEAALWSLLRQSSTREVRRRAFQHSLTQGLVSTSDAVDALSLEEDRVVQSLLARFIADTATPDVIAAALLHDASAESRALGLVRLTAEQIDPADLERLLVDPGELVRLWARQRWTEQGRDTLAAYQAAALGPEPARVRARAYRGLVEAGGSIDHAVAIGLVGSDEPPLQKAGLRLLADDARASDVPMLLQTLLTGTARVARLASEDLLEVPAAWSEEDLRPLTTSAAPELRRRAWWLKRGRSGWDETIADLEITLDDDPALAALGRNLTVPQFAVPTEQQRARLAELLPQVWPDTWRTSRVAFAAGFRAPSS
ncbi:hypothetical protein [Promicromonospora kroppenstedtii]|uniref:hypothetical protein n=1 Tax=Promicromonospora kroppenstedtii TaxID=440482 RepID=UPI0004ADAA18|nr:hypothetical protein [Promicromonospora kroppenstedtii]